VYGTQLDSGVGRREAIPGLRVRWRRSDSLVGRKVAGGGGAGKNWEGEARKEWAAVRANSQEAADGLGDGSVGSLWLVVELLGGWA